MRIAAVCAGFLAVFFLIVWIRTQVVSSGYQVTDLKTRLRQIETTLSSREAVLSGIKSRTGASRRAREKGWVLPGEYKNDRIRHIR